MTTHRLMRGGSLLYRCRRCGKVNDSLHCPSVITALAMIMVDGRTREPGIVAAMHSLCCCEDGAVGIADLIGCAPDAEPCGKPKCPDCGSATAERSAGGKGWICDKCPLIWDER